MRKNVTLICDLQFGSTGKGLIAGYLAEKNKPDVIVTAWSPNTGHTYINSKGEKFVHTMLANGIVSPNLRHVLIGPGSVINFNNLMKEVANVRSMGYLENVVILIHPHATIVTQEHRDIEEITMTAIGSTKKGSGAALIDKIKRNPNKSTVAKDLIPLSDRNGSFGYDVDGCIIRVAGFEQYNQIIDDAERIQIEGAQGFSLGINNGFYPYTTSRECTPAQIMVDCNMPTVKLNKVVGCMRTFPIRVANRYDFNGNMVGTSGPGYSDQEELDWQAYLGMEPELTTVTQLPRRLFSFSMKQTEQAIRMCAPDEIFLNFVNYHKNQKSTDDLMNKLNAIVFEVLGKDKHVVNYLGKGPTSEDIFDISTPSGYSNWIKYREAHHHHHD